MEESSSSHSSGPPKSHSQSQPLHNFDLPPLLKWNNKDGATPRRYRTMRPPHRRSSFSASPFRRSPSRHNVTSPHLPRFDPPLVDFAQLRHPGTSPPAPRFDPPLVDFAPLHHSGTSPPATRFEPHLRNFVPAPRYSLTPPPWARFEPPLRDFAPPRYFQTHLLRDPRVPPPPKEAALDDELDRVSLRREESLRHYRRREWLSSPERSDMIQHRRNPPKKTGFSPPLFVTGSSSSSENRTDDDVYRRNSLNEKSRLSSVAGEEGDALDRNPFNKPVFTFNSKAEESGGFRHSFNRSAFRPSSSSFSSSKRHSSSSTSQERNKHKIDASYPKEGDSSYSNHHFKRSGFSSPKNQNHPFSSSTSLDKRNPSFVEGDAYPKNHLPLKKSAFPSPETHASSSKSEEKINPNVALSKSPNFSKKSVFGSDFWKQAFSTNPEEESIIEKKLNVSEAKKGHASPMKKPAPPSPMEEGEIFENDETEEEGQLNPKSPLPTKSGSTAPKLASSSSSSKLAKAAESEAAAAASQLVKIVNSKKGKEKVGEHIPKNDDGRGDQEETKVWNLRPRNVIKIKPENAKAPPTGGSRSRPRNGGGEKKKLSIAVSLTREEIEEDIFALTGAKPSRRPKKHPKNVQKTLDTLFPGLCLLAITTETYKVSESSLK